MVCLVSLPTIKNTKGVPPTRQEVIVQAKGLLFVLLMEALIIPAHRKSVRHLFEYFIIITSFICLGSLFVAKLYFANT